MAKSVRISEELYDLARLEAGLMHRSVAQQLEHWAAIGQALEARGSLPEVREASLANLQTLEQQRVRSGKSRARDLRFIPADWARNAKVVWPHDAFREPRSR